MSEKIAQFRFTGFKILKSTIEVKENVEISDNLNVEFKQTSAVNDAELKFKHTLEVVIMDESNSLKLNVVAVGFYIFDEGLDDKSKNIFFNINAPAILFPYVRAYVTTLTSLSGIKPIILPTLNLSNRG